MLALLVIAALGAADQKKPMSANAIYNEGLRLMRTIEGPLRAGTMNPKQLKVAKDVERTFKRALKKSPNHGRAHINLAMLYRFTNRYQEAIPHLERGMTLEEGSKDWMVAAGTYVDVHFKQNKPAPAIPVLEKIVRHAPKDPQPHYQLGIALYYAGSPAKAKGWLEKTLKLDPNHAEAQALLNAINGG